MDGHVYTYGPGKYPPLMVGRDDLIRGWDRMLGQVSTRGRDPAVDTLLSGPRGVGKTCTMTAFARTARRAGYEVINLQAVADGPTLIRSLVRQADAAVHEGRRPWQRAKAALERFAGAQLGVGVFSVGVTVHESGTTAGGHDPESLASALANLAESVRSLHDHHQGGLMVTIDELQVAEPRELALVAAALQRLNVDHADAPVAFASTGLPHTASALRDAGVTHPERLLRDVRIPIQLVHDDARAAIVEPARAAGVDWHPDAVEAVLTASNCYPAHVQFFARAVWEQASGPLIEPDVVARALPRAIEELAETALGPDWDALTDREAELLTAVATLGGRASVTTLERALGRRQQQWSRTRESLVRAGVLYAPRRGELRVCVPAMADYAIAHYPDVYRSSTIPVVTPDALPTTED